MNVRPVTGPDEPLPRAGGRRGRFTWLAGIAAVLVGFVIVLDASSRVGSRPGSRPGEHRPGSAAGTSHPRVHPERAVGARNGSTPVPSLTPSAPPAPSIDRLVQLEQTPEESALLWDAVQLRIAACMEQRGFHYDRLPYDESVDQEGDRMRFKPGDVEAARQWGYGLARRMADSARREEAAAQRPRRRLSPEYREALAGPPPQFGERPGDGWGAVTTPQGAKLYWYRDSCLSHARDDVYGEDYAALELGMTISRLKTEVTAALASDDEVRAGLERWHACMAERGYSYSQPMEAMNALANDFHAGRLNLEDLRKQEIETAVADTACYASTGLTEVLAAARERAERAVLAQAAGTGEQLRSSLDNALARAETVLDGDPVR